MFLFKSIDEKIEEMGLKRLKRVSMELSMRDMMKNTNILSVFLFYISLRQTYFTVL